MVQAGGLLAAGCPVIDNPGDIITNDDDRNEDLFLPPPYSSRSLQLHAHHSTGRKVVFFSIPRCSTPSLKSTPILRAQWPLSPLEWGKKTQARRRSNREKQIKGLVAHFRAACAGCLCFFVRS